jgi:hypothetical protein
MIYSFDTWSESSALEAQVVQSGRAQQSAVRWAVEQGAVGEVEVGQERL